MKQKTVYAGLLLLILCCAACAAQPSARDFTGSWVVDMAASQMINPALQEREDMREMMSQVVMVIDMEKREMTIKHAQLEEQDTMPFTILEDVPGMLLIRVDDTDDVRLELKGRQLTFSVVDDPTSRDSFVFVPQGQ